MKSRSLLVIGLALVFAGCAEKAPEAPEAPEPATQPAQEPEVPGPEAEAVVGITKPDLVVDEDFLEHMHEHAAKLDDVNFALADGNLEEAKSPAYWLSRHESISGIPEEWQVYVDGMREAATAIENAQDLEAAQAAADRVTQNCQGCHGAAGIFME